MCSTDGLRPRLAPRARSRAGMSLVEVVVALSVLIVAASIFGQTLLSTSRVRQMNRENTLAADAARVVLERMRNEPFLEVFRDWNEDPGDDAAGAGTGPGHLFEVEGLEPLDGAPQGCAGRVTFPTVPVQVTTTTKTAGGKVGSYTTTTKTQYQLREDSQDAALGLPRDLDGDNVVDALDHSKNYLLLPVRVRIEWKSGNATRRFEIVTQLGDFREAGG